MKKIKYILVFFLLFFLSIIAYSQEVFPLSNAQWTESVTFGENPHSTTTLYRYILQGDTVIDNIKHSKVYFIPNINKRDTLLFGYFYVKDQVVYYRDSSENPYDGSKLRYFNICDEYFGKDYPLYDFSLEKGDTTCYVNCRDRLVVNCVDDTLLIDGVEHTRIFFNNGHNEIDLHEYWLEGIGSTAGLFKHVEKIPTGATSYQFVCFCHSGTVLYLNPAFSECPQADFSSINEIKQDMVNVSYNPTECTISISSPYLINRVKIVNASGILLQEEQINGKFQAIVHVEHLPEAGVYVAQIIFQDGRTISKKIISK